MAIDSGGSLRSSDWPEKTQDAFFLSHNTFGFDYRAGWLSSSYLNCIVLLRGSWIWGIRRSIHRHTSCVSEVTILRFLPSLLWTEQNSLRYVQCWGTGSQQTARCCAKRFASLHLKLKRQFSHPRGVTGHKWMLTCSHYNEECVSRTHQRGV